MHAHAPSRPIKLVRLPEVMARLAVGRSTIYKGEKDGTLPPSIPISARCVGWVEHEVDAVLAARIAGADDEAIRTLVRRLIEERQVRVPV